MNPKKRTTVSKSKKLPDSSVAPKAMSKRKKIQDPHAEREASKYENPIPSREYILRYLEERGRPALQEELAAALGIQSEEQQEALRRRLQAMSRDGQLISNRKGGYGLIDRMNLVRGRIIGHKDGYGFVVPDDGSADLFLTAYQMRAVFHGDLVLVRVAGIDSKGRREGAIVEILQSNTKNLVGRFSKEHGVAFVVPDNRRITQDIVVTEGNQLDAQDGQMVSVEIISQPSLHHRAIGRITEVLGKELSPGMEIDVAIRSHELPYIWSPEVLDEVANYNESVSETSKQAVGRVDIRHLPLVTIDGEDAQDFDDAVFCEARKGGGWCLYVAIADVSHYVSLGSALDKEAIDRGTSVYFPGRVIPMLPEVLSNGLCSLKPHVDRLCMVCEMTVSAAGKVTRYKFYPAVMNSKARLTYTEVAALFEKQGEIQQTYPELVPHLLELNKLYHVLRETREERGALDFETTETRIVFGENRKIDQIVPVYRNDAHKLIEECMLLANVSAANFLLKNKIPSLYRVHEGPTPEKVVGLRDFLTEFGLGLPGGTRPQPSDYASLLSQIGKRPDARLIQTVLLRSLKQAVYTPENAGHFGLAFPAYAHFTSPIRRYPDLLVHRAIRHLIEQGTAEHFHYDRVAMLGLGEHCSMTERRADEAVRDAMIVLKCEFMLDHVGKEFNGLVTAVTGFGLFVELADIYIEGLVHVTALGNDYYTFDPIRHRLSGQRTGGSYRLGDPIRVKVVRVSLDDRRIDFELAESGQPVSRKGKKTTVKDTAKDKASPKPKGTVKTSGKPRKPKRGKQ
jgi:ribonuclease R